MTFYKFRPFEMKCSVGSSPESMHRMSQSSFMARAMQSAYTHSSSSSSALSLELSILLSFVVVASLSILSLVSLSIIILA